MTLLPATRYLLSAACYLLPVGCPLPGPPFGQEEQVGGEKGRSDDVRVGVNAVLPEVCPQGYRQRGKYGRRRSVTD